MTDFLHTDARWGEHFVEINNPHKEGHHVRFYFEPPQDKLIVKLTEMIEIQMKLHETAIDMIKPAIEAEREACAKFVDHILKEGGGTYGDAIRARGQA